LLDVVLASLIVTVGVTIVFSLAIYGATRYAEVRRQERDGQAIAYGALTVTGLAVTTAVVALGLVEMLSK
jgi:uncharacterized membrane protein YidH (DUF202 family)